MPRWTTHGVWSVLNLCTALVLEVRAAWHGDWLFMIAITVWAEINLHRLQTYEWADGYKKRSADQLGPP